jgi:GT2 family glycosyltransferase/glycosyltransferase involved in cell wall biosynthesis
MKKFDIIIPVHGSSHWLSICLEELYKNTSSLLKKVIVVNDRSTEEQTFNIKKILKKYEGIVYLENNSGVHGFGGACNLGASCCESELVLFLNTDCLITSGSLDKISKCFDDEAIALACPISSNSADLTYKIWPGRSYVDMAKIISRAFEYTRGASIKDACTVVGNCLMVRRNFFVRVGGFSKEWGIGYGEETDLHMKACELGLRGVVNLSAYVYHFGGGTFNYLNNIESLRLLNYKNFMKKWGKQYKILHNKIQKESPLLILDNELKKYLDKNEELIELDVLFYLPGIDQTIGGLNAIISICNNLIRAGIKASCALVGIFSDEKLKDYKEPILFNFLYFISDIDFINSKNFKSKIVISTIFTSSSTVAHYCKLNHSHHIQFAQGYECYFENGINYNKAKESYSYSSEIVTTTQWLIKKISPHLSAEHRIQKMPLPVNTDIFFSFKSTFTRKYDVCFVLRSAPDKGQWLILEIIDRIVSANNLKILIIYFEAYQFVANWSKESITTISLPIDQCALAELLRESKVFVDCSHHEGYGLMPLEAALCGCNLVVTNSGGVDEFLKYCNFERLDIQSDVNDFVESIKSSVKKNNYSQNIIKLTEFNLWVNYLNSFNSKKIIISKAVNELKMEYKKETLLSSNKLAYIYRYFRPYIPNRLHLAIKILVKGR